MVNINYKTIEDVFTYENVKRAFNKCKSGKMWKNSVVNLYVQGDTYLFDVIDAVLSGNYKFDPLHHTYINERGKERLLSTLTIMDRLVCKVLNNNFLLEYYEPKLIRENCATLKNRGIADAVKIMKSNMQSMSSKYGTEFYIGKLDIKSYFDNIPHDKCLELVYKATYDDKIRKMFEDFFTVMYYDDHIHGGERIGKGIGLGGEICQTFGVILLNKFDHMMKEKFHLKYYVRYMDDIIFLHENKDYVKDVRILAEEFISNEYDLHFNERKTQVIKATRPVTFLKYKFKACDNGFVKISPNKRSVIKQRQKMKAFRRMLDNDEITMEDIEQQYYSHRDHNSIITDKNILKMLDNEYNDLFREYL